MTIYESTNLQVGDRITDGWVIAVFVKFDNGFCVVHEGTNLKATITFDGMHRWEKVKK